MSYYTLLFAVTAMILLANLPVSAAKRGCSNFGHSCYGGMGKRASTDDPYNTNDEVLQNGFQELEENPAFVFTGPRSSFPAKAKMNQQQYDNLSRLIRQWAQAYRKSQEMHSMDNNI